MPPPATLPPTPVCQDTIPRGCTVSPHTAPLSLWRKAEALGGSALLRSSSFCFTCGAEGLPSSYSLNPPPPPLLFLSLSPSVSARRSWNQPARPEREQGGKGGGGDQRPRDRARAVTAAASCRAPSPRSTSNNPAARGARALVRRRPPGPGGCAARGALAVALGATAAGPHEARDAAWATRPAFRCEAGQPAAGVHAQEAL